MKNTKSVTNVEALSSVKSSCWKSVDHTAAASSEKIVAGNKLIILSKTRAVYTPQARQNQVQGTVRLRVAFLADGTIGSVYPLNGLPHGLTEQAVAAAREIKFEPEKVNGQPVSVVKTLEYSFTIY